MKDGNSLTTTIQFFNCFLTFNGNRTNVSVSDFLDGVISLDEGLRYSENRYGEYSLLEMLPPTSNPNQNLLDRIVAFASYRNRKPYIGNRGTDERQEIKSDVLELTTALFIPTYHLAVIEYNHFGARPKHIETYLNAFLPKEENNTWDFELIPIETPASFTDIRQSSDIRSIEIKLDLLANETSLFNQEINDPEAISYRLLYNSAQTYRNIGANVATIFLGQGRYRSNPMDFDTLISLLQVINLDSDTFASVKVNYYSPTSRKVQTVDLKNEGYLKRVIMEDNNSSAFESVGIAISNYYYEQSNRLANSAWRQHVDELVGVEIPFIFPNRQNTLND